MSTIKPKHLILPSEAIITLDVLETLVEGTKAVHVAFVLGISGKHLTKERKRLAAAARGDEEACKSYNSRSPLMRNIHSLYHLLEVDREHVIELLRDALLWADAEGKVNVIHKRGGKEMDLAGLSNKELSTTKDQYENYIS